MPVKLRLQRRGRAHRPFYHIVAADSRSPRDGKFLDKVGTYDPVAQPAIVEIDHAKALQWLKNGAQPTETVNSLLSHDGVLLKLHLWRKKKDDATIEAEFQQWAAAKVVQKQRATDAVAQAKQKDVQARKEAERLKRAAIAERIAKKNTPVPEAPAAAAAEVEAPAAEAAAE